MTDFPELVGLIVIGLGLVVLVALLFTIPTWFLWNWLCPKLFGLPSVSLLETLGLLLLIGMFFGSSSGAK